MAGSTPLSEREVDIMRRVVTGASNREIAQALDISPNTVKVHLRNIYEKLGVASRTEATLVVLREGWVEVEGVSPSEEQLEEPGIQTEEGGPNGRSATESSGNGSRPADSGPDQPASEGMEAVAVLPVRETEMTQPHHLVRWLALALGVVLVLLLVAVTVLLRAQPSPTQATPAVIEIQRWQQLARLPEARGAAVATHLGRDLILIGGEGPGGVSGELWRYDSSTGRWEDQAPLPVPVRDAAVELLGGHIFVVGGSDEQGQPVALVQRYDPQADRWTEEAALPEPLTRTALVSFEGELFLFGGWDGTTAEDKIYRYLASEEQWELVGELPGPRADVAAAAVQDGIILVGGTDEEGEALADVLHFDPRRERAFRPEAPLPRPFPTPRLVTLGNALYLLGEGTLLERTPEQQWNPLDFPPGSLPRQAALVANDPYILVLGGVDESGPVATVWQYQAIFRTLLPLVPAGN